MFILNVKLPFEKAIVSFLLWLDSIIYKLFSIFYQTFIKLAQQEIFKSDAFNELYNNIYLIIGVIVLFFLAYIILKMIINSDISNGTKEIKNMIIRSLTSVILIILLPVFFGFLRDFQNTLLEYNIVPKILLNNQIAVQNVDENGNYVGEQKFIDSKDINLTTEVMKLRANEMVASIITGLMYPLKSDDMYFDGEPADKKFDEQIGTYRYYVSESEEWHTNVSEWWNSNSKSWVSGIGCAIGTAGLVIFTVVTGGASSALTIPLGSAAIACVGTALTGRMFGSAIASITATEYTWTNALQAIALQGNYSQITLFAKAIVDGEFHYTPILSTIVAGFLLYIMIGFCIDVVVRQAKLVFYQLLAPICFLLGIAPKNKDLMGKWFKLVFTCWAEIFIRLALVCSIVLLVGKLDLDRLTSIFHPIISTFIILGLVTFAKQIPKIVSELTGFDSGNMKLNLREKIADGGGFVAASVIGSGSKMFGRGLTNTWKAAKNNYEWNEAEGKWKLKDGKSWKNVAGAVGTGLFTTATGTARAQIAGGINAKNAKNMKDVKASQNQSVADVEKSQAKTKKYIAQHGGNIGGIGKGLFADGIQRVKNYLGDEDEILAKVSAEDNYITGFDDYENLYADSAYRALDAQKDQYEASIAAGVGYGNMSLDETKSALETAKEELIKKRMEAIATNHSGAAYVAYNLAHQVSEDPELARSIGASEELIRLAQSQDFVLRKTKSGETKLFHSNGKEWTTNELTNLFENKTARYTIDAKTGKATMIDDTYTNGSLTKGDELTQSKKDVKQKRNNDKNSVGYKEAVKKQKDSKSN